MILILIWSWRTELSPSVHLIVMNSPLLMPVSISYEAIYEQVKDPVEARFYSGLFVL